jgi:hypothetical protein
MLQRGRINEFEWPVSIGSDQSKNFADGRVFLGRRFRSLCMYRRDPVCVKGRVSYGGVHQYKRRLVQNVRSASCR